jgi:hypothetical protein
MNNMTDRFNSNNRRLNVEGEDRVPFEEASNLMNEVTGRPTVGSNLPTASEGLRAIERNQRVVPPPRRQVV